MDTTKYNLTIRSHLNQLDKRRLEIISNVKNRLMLWIALPLIFLAGVYFLMSGKIAQMHGIKEGILIVAAIAAFVYTTIVAFVFFNKAQKQYFADYKSVLVEPLMKQLFPDLKYSPQDCIGKTHFDASGLFRNKYTSYRGEDHFVGMVDGIAVEFSELTVANNQNSSGTANQGKSVLFDGVFMHIVSRQNVNNKIVIDPSEAYLEKMKMPTMLLNLIKRFLPDYGAVVKTGNEKFDKSFRLYSDNQSEALQIVNQQLIDKIIELTQKLNTFGNAPKLQGQNALKYLEHGVFLKIAFVNSSIYLAINGFKLFEVTLWKKAADSRETLMESLQYIRLLTELAKVV